MSVTSNNISALYITMFNRVPEGAGHKFWLDLANKQGLNVSQVAEQMLNSAPAKEYFAGKNADADFVNHIYSNLFGKTIAEDPVGSKFWIDHLKDGKSKAFIVSEMLNAATYNKYTKPEELKAQNLFLNKVKAAEIAYKAIENVPSSGTITEKIAGFAAVLKNIKDTSTPTQIAQVIKQEAMKANLTVLGNKELAQITKSVFPSVDASAAEKALDATTATTDIYANTPAPTPTPTPTPGGGGSSGGGSGSGSTPLTPEQQEQKAREEAVKQAEKNLEKAKEEAKQAQTDKLIANYVKEAVGKAVDPDTKTGQKITALNWIQDKINDSSTSESEKEALEKAKEIVSTFGRTLDEKKLVEVTGEAAVADKTKDVADKQKELAEAKKAYAEARIPEQELDKDLQKAIDEKSKADDNAVAAKAIKDAFEDTFAAGTNDSLKKIESAITSDPKYTDGQKKAISEQIAKLMAKQGIGKLDDDFDSAKYDALKVDAGSELTTANKNKAAKDGLYDTALNDQKANKVAIAKANTDVAQKDLDAAKAIVDLRDAEVKAAQDNKNQDPDNAELQETLNKATAAKAAAEAKVIEATQKLNEANAGNVAAVADKLNSVVLTKDGSVYKSADGKYTVDIGSATLAEGKTLVVRKTDNKLYEIDANSDALPTYDTKFNDKIIVKTGKDGFVAKNGAKVFKFVSKDGKVLFAHEDDNNGFALKTGVSDSYNDIKDAVIDSSGFKLNSAAAASEAAYKATIVKVAGSEDYKITKIDVGVANEYEFAQGPIIKDIEKEISARDFGPIKLALVNDKLLLGKQGNFWVINKGGDKVSMVQILPGDNYMFALDDNENVILVRKDGNHYTLKDPASFSDTLSKANESDPKLALAKISKTINTDGGRLLLKADGSGTVEKIQVDNNNELTLDSNTVLFNNTFVISNVAISKAKIGDVEFNFTNATKPAYDAVIHYKVIEGKNLLKGAAGYVETEAVVGNNKYVVSNVAADKYTLTKKTADNAHTISVEKLEGGITKTVDANGVKLAGTDAVNSDTVTVDANETTVAASGNANVVGVQNLNAGKVSFSSVEKVVVNSATALDGKGLEVLNKAAGEIMLGANLTLNNANDGTLDLSKVKDGGHNLNVDVTNNAKSDTIKFGTEIAGDRLNINGFEKTQDKVDFSALGVAKTSVTTVEPSAGLGLENAKIYTTKVTGDIAAKNYAGTEFGELFAASGTAFKTAATAAGKSIVAVKGTDVTKIYQVDNAEGTGADTITPNEVKLIGTFNSGVELGDGNIA